MVSKILDGLLSHHPGSPTQTAPLADGERPNISAISGTLGTNVPDAVSLDPSAPLDLSYAGDETSIYAGDAKALAAAVQAEGQEAEHRHKQPESPYYNYFGLVTKTIPPNSPEFHSADGRAAINKEVGGRAR